MDWSVSFFSEKVAKETKEFPKGILANFLHITDMIQDFGPNLGLPHTKAMGKGLFEIRAKGKEGIGRSLFCTIKNNEIIIILNSFIKKSNKTPTKELNLARKRMKEVNDGKN